MTLLVIVISSLLQVQQTPLPKTPQGCVQGARDLAARRMKELAPTTADTVRQVTAERLALLRDCAAQFDLTKVPVTELAALVELYMDSQQLDLGRQALARGLSDTTLETPVKAGLLLVAVRATLRQPKSDERNALAERYLEQLDALGEPAIEQRFSAHTALNNYYRADDIDAGIIKHSTWMMEAGRKFTEEQRKRLASSMISAYVNLAEAVAGQGENDRALDLLKRAPVEWPEAPYAASRVKDVLERYALVGTAAPAIAAPVWLNRPASGPLAVKGKVTLLQFTAHWCGPCKESYPGMKRLLERLGKEDFQIVFYTRTYGYFDQERNLTAEQEIDRDKKYFAGYGFTLPIAIGTPSSVVVDGKSKYQEDPVEEAFAVGGIPQINVIDRHGNIRRVMIGYDDANEDKLAAFIRTLLNEK